MGQKLTPIRNLTHKVLNRTLIRRRHSLLSNRTTPIIKALRLIHRTLKRIALPAEHIVGVRTIPTRTLKAPDKRIRRTGRPHAVELAGIPRRLVGYLRGAHGVSRWAGWSVDEAVGFDGVEHVGLVVGAVEVLAVPASVVLVRVNGHIDSGERRGLLTRGSGG